MGGCGGGNERKRRGSTSAFDFGGIKFFAKEIVLEDKIKL